MDGHLHKLCVLEHTLPNRYCAPSFWMQLESFHVCVQSPESQLTRDALTARTGFRKTAHTRRGKRISPNWDLACGYIAPRILCVPPCPAAGITAAPLPPRLGSVLCDRKGGRTKLHEQGEYAHNSDLNGPVRPSEVFEWIQNLSLSVFCTWPSQSMLRLSDCALLSTNQLSRRTFFYCLVESLSDSSTMYPWRSIPKFLPNLNLYVSLAVHMQPLIQ